MNSYCSLFTWKVLFCACDADIVTTARPSALPSVTILTMEGITARCNVLNMFKNFGETQIASYCRKTQS